jgi:SOS regulatory protein LexA
MNKAKDKERLERLSAYVDSHKRVPTFVEMTKLFGVKSKNAVHKIVNKFVALGFLERDAQGKIIPAQLIPNIPLLGSVTAGMPMTVDGDSVATFDTLDLEKFLVDKRSSTYFLEVDGDSMIDAHIADGDLVLVEKVQTAKDGDIVIACIDGDWTMKYLRSKSGRSWLEPANKNYKPLYPSQSLEVAAIVKAVIRKY